MEAFRVVPSLMLEEGTTLRESERARKRVDFFLVVLFMRCVFKS